MNNKIIYILLTGILITLIFIAIGIKDLYEVIAYLGDQVGRLRE